MFKDIILAIILGALLGFGLTGGYFAFTKKQSTISSNSQPNNSSIISSTPSISVVPTIQTDLTTVNHQITIESPQHQSIVNNSKITIKGSTSPNSILIITTPTSSYQSTSDATGNFNVDVEINSGANLINISSFDQQDNTAKTSILVTYSTSKI